MSTVIDASLLPEPPNMEGLEESRYMHDYLRKLYQGARVGDALDSYMLGKRYLLYANRFAEKDEPSLGCKTSCEQYAVRCFLLSGQQGKVEGYWEYANLVLRGLTELDPSEGEKYLSLAVEQSDGEIAFKLAMRFLHGDEQLPKNEINALKWFKVAALSNYYDRGMAGYYAAYLTQISDGDEQKKTDEAIKFYTIAAENGHVESMFRLAVLHEELPGVAKGSSAPANKWYINAAKSGYSEAMLVVAEYAYDTELYDMANHWYIRAKECGNITAMFKLAEWFIRSSAQVEPFAEKKGALLEAEQLYILSRERSERESEKAAINGCIYDVRKKLAHLDVEHRRTVAKARASRQALLISSAAAGSSPVHAGRRRRRRDRREKVVAAEEAKRAPKSKRLR